MLADQIVAAFSGEFLLTLAKLFAAEPEEIRRMLLDLRRRRGWSQGVAAAMLGVSRSALVKWEGGARKPCGSAARLICVLHASLAGR
jgi:DNA-binding transcriptional regulator YiaG